MGLGPWRCARLLNGWINKRELMVLQIAEWSLAVWAAVVGVPVLILGAQLSLSAWLSRRRIEVHADRVIVRGVLRDTEVPIQGVVSVVHSTCMRSVRRCGRATPRMRAHPSRLAFADMTALARTSCSATGCSMP